MKLQFYFFITIVFCHNICYSQDWKVFPYTPQASAISFPKDEGRHSTEPVEWWYTSGHLTGATSGKTYSYMLTYFSFPVASFDGFRILNITDEETGKFYQDSKPVNYGTLANGHLDIQANVYQGDSESWSNKKDGNNKLIPYQYIIHAASPGLQLNLNYTSLKRPLILGGTGYLEQGMSNYTWYYAQTQVEVAGQFTLNGVTEEVKGLAWIDRQYGNFNPWTGEKYEWFHAQLSNGTDMNFWNIFTTDNKIPNNKKYCLLSAYVNDSTQYTISDFKMERLGYSWMPDSAMCYADKWRLTSEKNNMDLIITTKHHNNEVTWPFRFFEGATEISGTVNGVSVTGVGFAELLHSYQNPQVIIKSPDGGKYNTAAPVTWKLINPDDGNPVTYNLEYSIDDKATFKTIAQGIKDTSYQWNQTNLRNSNKVWFKITAVSVDGNLKGTTVSSTSASVVVSNADLQTLHIFPNPVHDYLFLTPAFQMNNPAGKITDVNGRVVYSIKNSSISNKIDVGFLPPGLYFLKIGEWKKAVKFIKK